VQVDEIGADVAGEIDAADQERNAVGLERVGLPGSVDGEKDVVGCTRVANPPARLGVHVRLVPARDAAVGVFLLVREPLEGIEAMPQGEVERLQGIGTGDRGLVADTDAISHDSFPP
jgi:hypothetical protein